MFKSKKGDFRLQLVLTLLLTILASCKVNESKTARGRIMYLPTRSAPLLDVAMTLL